MKSKLDSKLNAVKTLCNEYIRLRDTKKQAKGQLYYAICISCSGMIELDHQAKNRDYHAGHYWLENKYSSVRFDEDNIHGQCLRCNRFLHGNLAEYAIRLENKIGTDKVALLEWKRNKIKKWTMLELEDLERGFKEKINIEKKRLGLLKG